jgi:hypothetical protein
MSASQTNPEAQQFWGGVSKWHEDVQRSFWDASAKLSAFIGENPVPHTLAPSRDKPPADWPLWKKLLFYTGQGQINHAAGVRYQGQATIEAGKWLWGALQGDFNKNPTTGQMITGGLLSMIPFVDQLCDVRDVTANCIILSTEDGRADSSNWIALGLTCLGFVPLIGSAVKTVAKVCIRKGAKLLDLIKQMEWLEALVVKTKGLQIPWGRAPLDWLRTFDWQAAAKQAADVAVKAFQNALEKVRAAIDWAVGGVKAKLQRLAEGFSHMIERVGKSLQDAATQVRAKIGELLSKESKDVGKYDAVPGSAPNKHAQRAVEPLRAPSAYGPPLKSRHSIRHVKQGGFKKDKTTVAEPHIDMNGDVAAINRGEGGRQGNLFTVNGRTYELVNGDHLVPHSGPGFHQLNRGEFDALGVFNKFGDTNQAREIASRVAGKDGAEKALQIWRLGK